LPQRIGRNAGAGERTGFHEVRQFLCDLQVCAGYILSHFWLQSEHWCPGRVFIVGNALAGLSVVQKRKINVMRKEMKLKKHMVEKPWGRTDIPSAFGDMAGRRIGEVWFEGEDSSPFPILIKWLFTSEKLSIQVHPNDEQAKARGQASGKEECWFVVNADPGAVLGIGTTKPLSATELRAASESGEIEHLMDWKPVKAGDYFYIPAGTVHAIGAGVTLVEVQQYADITYRLYDYGRPRALHLDDGVDVSTAELYADARSGNVDTGPLILDSTHFHLRHVTEAGQLSEIPTDEQLVLIPVEGKVIVEGDSAIAGDCLIFDALPKIAFGVGAKLLIAW
jgi:mannose-6-phosphate isomerase